jgi:hypothetical protein
MSHRHITALTVALLAASPALAEESEMLRLVCRADNPALLAEPLAFSLDLGAKEATETLSGAQFGITTLRDGLNLWEKSAGPAQVVFRIDRVSGRFARVDKQIRLEGTCEKVERKF